MHAGALRASTRVLALWAFGMFGACATFTPPAEPAEPMPPVASSSSGLSEAEREAALDAAIAKTQRATNPPGEERPPAPPPAAGTKKTTTDATTPDLEAVEREFGTRVENIGRCETAPRAKPKKKGKLIWPVEGVVVSAFGQREGSPHDGIDIGAPAGTPVWASRDGEVLYSGERSGYGQIVILRHDDGSVTVYAHNAKNCVSEKKRVNQGDVIALVGATGGATSPAVHFEVRVKNKAVNPRGQLPN